MYGGPGAGKTTLIAEMLAIFGKRGATLVFDPTGDTTRALRKALPKGQKIIAVSSVAEYKKLTTGSFLGGQFSGFVRGEHVVIGLPEKSKRAASDLENNAALWVYLVSHPVHREMFVASFCDESEQVFPATGRIDPAFRESILFARNEGRAIVLATKRPTALAPPVRSAALRLCVFRVMSDADARACSELGPAVLFADVQYLPFGEYMLFDPAEHKRGESLPRFSARERPEWL